MNEVIYLQELCTHRTNIVNRSQISASGPHPIACPERAVAVAAAPIALTDPAALANKPHI